MTPVGAAPGSVAPWHRRISQAADLPYEYWQRAVVGRCALALGLFAIIAALPMFGPNRLWLALGFAVANAGQNLALGLVLRARGHLPWISAASDQLFVVAAGVIAPMTFVWGMVVTAITLPLSVISYGRAFSYKLVAFFAPVYLAIGLWREPDLWPVGLGIFVIGGLGSCSLVGYAAAEERRVRERYIDILDQVQVVVFESPGVGLPLTYVNDHVGKMLGYTPLHWIDPQWWESRVHPEDHAAWAGSNDRTNAGESHQAQYRLIAEDGRIVHVLELTRVLGADHGHTRTRGVLVDVTRQSEAEAQASQLGMFVDQIPLALQILQIADPDDIDAVRMVAANQVACDQVGATLDELLTGWPDKYSKVDRQPGIMEAFAEVRRSGEALTDFERPWVDETGRQRRVNLEAFDLGNGHVGVSYEDITERAAAAEALRHQATHDALTGLPNRVLLAEHLAEAMSDEATSDVALLLMDLNQFKEVNDSLGHHHGDRLLIELSHRLRAIADGNHLIARLGGDEFAMLIKNDSARAALEMANVIGRRFAEPIEIDGVTLQTNVSVGVALYPEHATDADGLMQRSDAAMYRAKAGGTGVSLFTPEHSTVGNRRLQIISDLRTAIERGELVVHYQPRVDFETDEIEGVEALVRWQHPTLGMLPPDEFIGLAEVSGLIQDLTRFVIRVAVADIAYLKTLGHSLPVAVNLSVRNLYSPDLVDNILQSLAAHQLDSSHLRVELTESEIMDDPAMAMQVLQRLRSEGVEVSIDDFGTGYSSLSYLRDLPIDEIKIDKSFVADITDGDDVVVRSIIDLGHALGVSVVGEGVETAVQWDHLKRLGCDVAQGYLISRPLNFDALHRFLDDRVEFRAAAALGAVVTPG